MIGEGERREDDAMPDDILLATDGSASAIAAARWCRQHFSAHETRIMLVTVVEPLYRTLGVFVSQEDVLPNEAGDAGRLVLDRTAAELNGFGITKRIRYGRPAYEILRTIQESTPDLVVLGHRGWGGLESMILGSVAQDMVKRSPIPVLVCPSPHHVGAIP